MELIIDASSILAVLLDEPERKAVLKVTKGYDLVAPSCLPLEIGNATSCLVKRRSITVSDAVAVYHEFCKIPIRFVEQDIPYSLIIAGEEKTYAYDAYYISSALRLGLELCSLDNKLISVAKERGVTCL